jgi:hypothetical protein
LAEHEEANDEAGVEDKSVTGRKPRAGGGYDLLGMA